VIAQMKPAGCHPRIRSSSSWMAPVSWMPNSYRFSVQPNTSRAPRDGIVVVGDQKVLIRQAGAPGPQFAVAPGRIALRTDGERSPSSRRFTVFSSDKNLTYTVSPLQPWIRVSPAKGTPGSRRFDVKIDPEHLHAGRNEGVILISAAGSTEPPLRLQVTVEIPRLR